MEDAFTIACRILIERVGKVEKALRACNEVEEYNALKEEVDELDEVIFYVNRAEQIYRKFK